MEEKLTFEEALKKLESLVKEMESGNLNLDDSVEKYQEGMKLAKYCSEELKHAEGVIVKLMKQGELVDFDEKE